LTEPTTILQEVGQVFPDYGLTVATTALIGGTIALMATVTRKAFTNDAMLARLDRELLAERTRVDCQRADLRWKCTNVRFREPFSDQSFLECSVRMAQHQQDRHLAVGIELSLCFLYN